MSGNIEHDSIYLLDRVVLAALERHASQPDALRVTVDEYELEIADNTQLWRNIVENAAIYIAVHRNRRFRR